MSNSEEETGCAGWWVLDITQKVPVICVFLQLALFTFLSLYLRGVRRCALRKNTAIARAVILPSFEPLVRMCLFSTFALCILFMLEWDTGSDNNNHKTTWCVPNFFILADFVHRDLSLTMMFIAPLEYFLYWFFSNLMYLSTGVIFLLPSLSKNSFRKANTYGFFIAFITAFWRVCPFLLFSNFQAQPSLCIGMELILDIILFLLYCWVLTKSNNRNFSSRPLVVYNIIRLLLQILRFFFQFFVFDINVLNFFLYFIRGVCVVPCLYFSLLRDTWYWRGETKLPTWLNPMLFSSKERNEINGKEFWNVKMSVSSKKKSNNINSDSNSSSNEHKNRLLNSLDGENYENNAITRTQQQLQRQKNKKNVRKSDLSSFIDANDDRLIDFTALDLSDRVVLGRGVSSVVYLGILRNCKVAVKCFNPLEMDETAIATYQTEVAISAEASQGDNPYMLEFYGLCVSPPDICMVFELCERGDLRRVLKEYPHMPWELKFNLAKQCVACVGYLHKMGAIHLDIKPENFLLTFHWQVKLGDFGLARTLASLASRSGENLGCVGTVGYMSPEMLRGDVWGMSTDIFSLAVVVWEIMSHKVAFSHLNSAQVLTAIMHDERPPLSGMGFSAPLKALFSAAWSPDPNQRPTAAEFESALNHIAVTYPNGNGVDNDDFLNSHELKTSSLDGAKHSMAQSQQAESQIRTDQVLVFT